MFAEAARGFVVSDVNIFVFLWPLRIKGQSTTRVSTATDRPARRRCSTRAKIFRIASYGNQSFLLCGLAAEYKSRQWVWSTVAWWPSELYDTHCSLANLVDSAWDGQPFQRYGWCPPKFKWFTWPNHAHFWDGCHLWVSTCYRQHTYQIWSLFWPQKPSVSGLLYGVVCVMPFLAFFANVNSRSRSLYAIAVLSVVCLSVCNVRALYIAGWNFQQFFRRLVPWPLTSTENVYGDRPRGSPPSGEKGG